MTRSGISVSITYASSRKWRMPAIVTITTVIKKTIVRRRANVLNSRHDFSRQIRQHPDARSGPRSEVLDREGRLPRPDRSALQRETAMDRAARRLLRYAL